MKTAPYTSSRSTAAAGVPNAQLMAEINRLKGQLAAQAQTIQTLKREAQTDPLTGLANRRAFEKTLDDSMAYFNRYGRPGALLMVDLNAFKPINDTLGHAAGDAILQHVSGILKAHTRRTDLVARVGGDEFCILLREAGRDEAMLKIAEIEAVIASSPCRFEGRDIYISLSIGACTFADAPNKSVLLEKADAAMYKHKRAQAPKVVRI